jgi:uncharacterized membrane protein
MSIPPTFATDVAKVVVDEISVVLKKILEGNRENRPSKLVIPHKEDHQNVSLELVHWTVMGFNFLGLFIMVVSTLAILPTLIGGVVPNMFFPAEDHRTARKNHYRWLQARMHLARGLILGMDLMVASDIIETLMHEVDLLKLVCIVAVRSWLGYERSKEFEHMIHEESEVERKRKASVAMETEAERKRNAEAKEKGKAL